MDNSHKILFGLVGLTLLLTAGNFALSVTRASALAVNTEVPATNTEIEPVSNNDQPRDTERQNISGDVNTYSEFGLTFQYPVGWHMYVRNIFDDPKRIKALHEIFLNDSPVTLTSPSGGPGMWAKVTMHSLDEGEARYAPYENGPWKEYLTDEITINGQKATRLRITASDDAVYEMPYQEVIFIGGYEIVYGANSVEEAKNDAAWQLIQNSITIK